MALVQLVEGRSERRHDMVVEWTVRALCDGDNLGVGLVLLVGSVGLTLGLVIVMNWLDVVTVMNWLRLVYDLLFVRRRIWHDNRRRMTVSGSWSINTLLLLEDDVCVLVTRVVLGSLQRFFVVLVMLT